MKKKSWKRRILQYLDLPSDLDPALFRWELVSNEHLLVEQHRGVLSFDFEEIRFQSEGGVVQINGSELLLQQLSKSAFLVKGTIESILFEDKS